MAATTTASTYTVTIPSSLAVAHSGWNATDGISTSGTLGSGEKLTVTASSANNWALRSGGDSVGYRLASSDGGAQVTSWEFDSLGGAARPLGAVVENYDTKPAGTYKDTVTFTAKVKSTVKLVTKVNLSRTSASIWVGGIWAISAWVEPSDATNGSLSWASSDPSVATVTDGSIRGVAPGTATVTATANDGSGAKASCAVTVLQRATGVTLSSASTQLVEGNSTVLTASVAPTTAYDRSVSWTSSNASVATVDSAGKVTAVAPGTATVTATANGGSGVKASCTVTVIPSLAVAMQKCSTIEITLKDTRPAAVENPITQVKVNHPSGEVEFVTRGYCFTKASITGKSQGSFGFSDNQLDVYLKNHSGVRWHIVIFYSSTRQDNRYNVKGAGSWAGETAALTSVKIDGVEFINNMINDR